MRVALKIAYDGSVFYGHQRQPDRRTVEGECLTALRSAKVLRDPRESFFRSASRTDRGVSAVGNVIAFDTSLAAEAVVGAFNDRARGVWAWAVAEVPESFHPRHALQRWYRYHLLQDLPVPTLRRVATLFVGEHDFRSFTSDPAGGPLAVDRVDVSRAAGTVVIDIRAASFRRGMVRRIVSAAVGVAKGLVAEDDIRSALSGTRADFGMVRPEPLFLMDVRYPFPMKALIKPKVRDQWRMIAEETKLRRLFLDAISRSIRGTNSNPSSREGA
jgi:tRNA pseudouridine38-40 synthase